MSDIVERLRNGEPCAACWGDADGTCKVKDARSGCGCAEAADEITRLRAEVEKLKAARDLVLEEAARVVVENYQELCTEHRLLLLNRANAIRALKSGNDS